MIYGHGPSDWREIDHFDLGPISTRHLSTPATDLQLHSSLHRAHSPQSKRLDSRVKLLTVHLEPAEFRSSVRRSVAARRPLRDEGVELIDQSRAA